MDSIEKMLQDAGQLRQERHEGREALRDLVRLRTGARPSRIRRVLVPAVSIGGILAVLGTGAAIATQWGPWSYVSEADISITREWVDIDGNSVGACESRLAVDELPPEALDAAREYLSRLNTDVLAPDPEVVASLLVAVDRPDRMPQLIPGAQVSDYDITHTGPSWDQEWWSDARILQDGLVSVVFAGMADDLTLTWPELNTADASISSKVQTQCTTDPAGLWQE